LEILEDNLKRKMIQQTIFNEVIKIKMVQPALRDYEADDIIFLAVNGLRMDLEIEKGLRMDWEVVSK
jgi:hypothetical protein